MKLKDLEKKLSARNKSKKGIKLFVFLPLLILVLHILGALLLLPMGWIVAKAWNHSLSLYIEGISNIDFIAGFWLIILATLLITPIGLLSIVSVRINTK